MTAVLDDAARARLIDRFGPDVETWCDELPGLVTRLTKRWGLTVIDAKPGNTGRTLICTGTGGTRVLKLTPDHRIAADEATALSVWAGCSRVVQILDADLAEGAILLEGIEPGTQLTGRGTDIPWHQLGELITQLHSVPARGEFPPLAERIETIYDLYERRLVGSAAESYLPLELLRAARKRAALLAATGPVALLHGDLHPANVLDGGPVRGIVAIDPRPSLGDPAIDLADWVLLPLSAGGTLDDGIGALGPYLPDLDVDRVLAWCVALAPLLAFGPLRNGGPTPFTDALLELAR
jgi:streptomycin 6-kinase